MNDTESNRQVEPKRFKAALVSLALLLSTSAGFVGGWLGADSRSIQTDTGGDREIVINESNVITEIAKEVGPSVVSVNVVGQSRGGWFGGFETASAGTGFIISTDGVVVTNRHVVPVGTSEVSVTLSDGTELDEVEVIGRTGQDDSLDIAFLKINDAEGKDLQPVKLGNSSAVEVGEKVVAIGNALGQFANTVTSGIISGYGRSVEATDGSGSDSLQNLFQTDAAINQGNSGGPLVNINGEVIGVNTAVAGGAENIGFSIPIDDIKGLISGVLEEGELKRPYLGVRYVPLNEGISEELGLNVASGAYILPSEGGQPSIVKDSPAADAGLKEGDIITKIDGQEINDDNSLTSLIGRRKVGEEVTLTIIRDGKTQELKATLEELPE